MSHNENATYLTCPRCRGAGIQKADDTREGKVGQYGGTILHNLEAGKCTFCDGAGKIKMGGLLPTDTHLPDNPGARIEWK
jgi:RecJ-like exonuclease